MSENSSDTAFAYHEPPIATILNQAGFLVALNLVNVCLDKLLYCGLIGQLFIGILWGTPGAKWLNQETEAVIQQLGYLGLIMLVYEGGLSTSIKAVRANLVMSLCVAITGIGTPMGLSFILKELVGASPLQSFAAGAALSATSLGTTFTILSSTGLVSTRLGTVTTSAAMLDDVVGLVMVQIISNLGQGTSSFDSITVIRPVFVSIGFALGLFLLCAFVVKPCLKKILSRNLKVPTFMTKSQFAFLYQTSLLVGIVAGATYAGTSSLFAAYLAGVIVTWIDEMIAESRASRTATSDGPRTSQAEASTGHGSQDPNSSPAVAQSSEMPTGEQVYEKFYRQPVGRILTPLFFASIGFAVPITEMFKGRVIWRGIVYAILMTFGKAVTGIWLVRFSPQPVFNMIKALASSISRLFHLCIHSNVKKEHEKKQPARDEAIVPASERQPETSNNQTAPHTGKENATNSSSNQNRNDQPGAPEETSTARTAISPPKPRSLYPPAILGLAMVARGEIGYLVASLAQAQGIFGSGPSGGESDIYLVVIWGISICTLVGPICVGTVVKRLRKLQETQGNPGPDPLGAWGI